MASPPSTLLLRPVVLADAPAVRRLLPGITVRPDEQVLVLADLTGEVTTWVRAATVVRREAGSWTVVAAAVDDRWPPVAAALVEQLRSTAAAAGAVTLTFSPHCGVAVRAALAVDSRSLVGVGGSTVLEL